MSEYNTYMNMAPVNPAVAAVKKTGGSALFLIATITYTVLLLLSLISAFMPSTASVYADLLYEMTYDYSVYEAVSAMNAGSIVWTLIGSIPTILITAGLWMIWGASKTKNPRVSTAGFTMINVVEIFMLVLISIALAIVCIVMLIGALAVHETMSYASSWGFGAESAIGIATTAFIAIFAILILFCVLAIIYYAKLVGSIRVIKKAANGIVAGKKISLFVIVINFIMIGFNVIGLIGNLMFFNFLTLFSNLLSIAFNVLITIALIQMRGHLNRIALENAMNNTMSDTGSYTDYNTGSYNNFNTGSVPPVQSQYEQTQAPQYGQSQQGQFYGQPQQFGQQTGGYQYQQPQQGQQYGQPQQYQQQAPQQNQNPWNGGQQ